VTRSATVRDLRRRNRARVLRDLLLAGESTRAALAESGALSTATMTNVISDLMAEGLVEEVGRIPSDGGRPIARLSPRGDSAYFLGADVGEQGVTVELFDLRFRRVDRAAVRVRRSELGPDSIRHAIDDAISALRERHPVAARSIVGLGAGLPGAVRASAGGPPVVDVQTLGWTPIELGALIGGDLAIFAENGAKTMAMAEAWHGAASQTSHSVSVLIGRGLGAGIIHDGRLLRGVAGSAGEWGHTKVAVRGRRCGCGSRGCLEAYVGGASIIERWAEAGATVTTNDEGELTRLLDEAAAGDARAEQVVADTVEILGIGLGSLVNALNPEVVVIGGWVGSALADTHGAALAEHMRSNSLIRPAADMRLEPSRLGLDAVAFGAALLPLEELIEGRLPVPDSVA